MGQGIATGTQRAASTRRIVEAIASLDGFSDVEEDGSWFVSRPYAGRQGRRQVIVGWSVEGDTITTGIAAEQQPADDAWTLPVAIYLDDEFAEHPEEAEEAVEAAYNAIATLLAHNQRLSFDGREGPAGVRDAMARNPSIRCSWEPSSAPSALCTFDITLTCSINRRPRT